MKNVLVIGGTGLIGRHLAKYLKQKNYNVAILTRYPDLVKDFKAYKWDLKKKYIETEAISNSHIIVYLAGENISIGRWTNFKKQKIFQSRVQGLNVLYEYTKKFGYNVEALVSASAIGFYGTFTSEKILDENSLPGKDFLAKVCSVWENEAWRFENLNIKVSIARTGIVLAPDGGIVKRLYPIAKLGLLSPLGTGKQYFPWIHIEDLVKIYLWMIEEQLQGVYNAVAPEYINSEDFVHAYMKAMNKKVIMPNIPNFILKIIFGQKSSIMLYGTRISAQKLINHGFKFSYENIYQAMKELVKTIY